MANQLILYLLWFCNGYSLASHFDKNVQISQPQFIYLTNIDEYNYVLLIFIVYVINQW